MLHEHSMKEDVGRVVPPSHLRHTAGLWVAALLACTMPASAQQGGADQTRAEAQRLLTEALGAAERGDTAVALARAERASRLAPDLADARFLYGLLLARTSAAGGSDFWRRLEADREFEAALRLDSDNPAYLLEVARVRLKQPLLRIQAERLFRRALSAAQKKGDPQVEASVAAEIGDIYFRRYQAVANRRMVLGALQTFDWESAMRDQYYTRDLLLDNSVPVPNLGEIDLTRAELHYRAGVAAMPASEAANRGLLALLAETGRDEEFLDAARRFARVDPSSGTAQLYLGLGLWRDGRGRAADSAFARALAALPPAQREPLEDLSPVLTAGDAVAYRTLRDSTRAAFEALYWRNAEPLRLSPENEYRLEHLARVAYADLLFGAPDLRLRGWLTDRGQIHIRYGPPDVIASFSPEPYATTDDVLGTGAITTVWFYPARNLRFVFQGPPAYNYQRLAYDFHSYAENVRSVSPVTYDNVAVTRNVAPIAVQVAQFRPADDSGGTEVLFFAGIPVRTMVAGVDLHSSEMETGLFITDSLYRDHVAERASETVRFAADDQFEVRTRTVRLAPGTYAYRFEAQLGATDHAARGMDQIAVESFGPGALSLSDVVVADRVALKREGTRPRGRRDILLDPSAAREFRRSDPVHLYAEAYNLTAVDSGPMGPTARFQVSVRLRIEELNRGGLVARVFGGVLDAVGVSAEGDDQVVLQYLAREPLEGRDRIPVYLALDLTGAPVGTYRLDLAITDLVTGSVAVRHRDLRVVEGP